MKKIFKRVSAAVMALAVAATAVVFDVPQKLVAAAAVSRSSSSGEYRIDSRGNLTIYSDTGMTDWKENGYRDADDVQTVEMDSSVTSIPEEAFGFCRYLTSVEIGSGVQTIDAEAFYNCSSLTEITVAAGNSKYSSADGVLFNTDKTQLICYPEGKQGSSYEIPSTVTSIEQSAFENCQKLASVTAAAGSRLTTIESDAFNHCTALTSIEIPESVTSLGTNAFNGCKNLQNITIPASLTSMSIDESHGNPFINCSNLTAINVEAGNTAYSSVNGVLFNKDQTKLICCPEGTEDGYTIPNTVTSVETWAFYACKKFVSVTIPNTVTSIGDKAFSFCTALTSVTIPDTVTSIGDEMFSNCYKLASVTIPNSVTSIGNKAFYNCYNDQFTSVTIPKSVNSIGDEAFSGCSKLTTVTFKSTTPPTIGNNIFYQYTNKLEKIMVPARSVDTYKAVSNLDPYKDKIVEGEADNPCGDNATWEYDETTKTLTISGTGAMTNWTSTTSAPWAGKAADIKNVVIEEGITSIGNYAFKDCSSLSSITIPESVTSLGNYTFNGCTSLSSIKIPNNVKTIGIQTFKDCSSLTSVTIPNSVNSIGNSAFYGCTSLSSITISESVTSIGNSAFQDCTSLSSITIPKSVTSIGNNAFRGCTSLSSIKIPNGVKTIGSTVFFNCSSLTSITIPESVTSIDTGTFNSCSNLTSVTIPNSVTSIGRQAFMNCTKLMSITIPESVTSIKDQAFSDCTNLETVTFDNATPPATIGTNLFNGCTNLAEILVPAGSAETYKGLERLDPYKDKIFEVAAENSCGDNATWAYDEATKTLTISGTGTMTDWTDTTSVPWADKAANIQKVVIEDGITSIGDNAFNGCSSLTNVTISKDVTTIGKGAFNGCSNLANVTLPDSVTTISSGAFMSCTSLTGITIPKNVTTIGNNAFDSCTNLKTVTFEGTTPPTTIGSNVFNECSSDLTINVPEGKADAYKNALADLSDKVTDGTPDNKCGANATWTLDETTKTLTISGTGNMSNWVASGNIAPWLKDTGNIGKIKNVVINEGITSVGNYAFCRCLLLTSVTIPSSVTFIGDCAFNSCSALTSITIPSSVTSIGSSAFFNCGNLTSITIPKDVRSIGTGAFDRCSKLSEIIYKDGLDVSRTSIPDTATQVKYTVNDDGTLKVTAITLGTGKTNVTITDAMNIVFVDKNYREKVAQTGHTHLGGTATCSDKAKCDICDAEHGEKADHDWGVWTVTTAPTLAATGTATRVCDNNREHKETKTLPKINLDSGTAPEGWTVQITKPTFSGAGKIEYKEGSTVVTAVTLPALNDGTVWTKKTTGNTEPGVNTVGSYTYTSDYGEVTVEVPKLSDTTVWAKDSAQHVAPTKENTGKDVYKSKTPGLYPDVTVTIPALSDESKWTKTHSAPTLTADGSDVYISTEFGTVTVTIPSLANTAVWEKDTTKHKDPTLSAKGEDVYKSKTSGLYADVTAEIPALSDTSVWTKDDTQHIDPTDTDKGQDVYKSKSDIYPAVTVILPELNHEHTLVKVDEVPATTGSAGVKEHWHCSDCNKDFADAEGTQEITDVSTLAIPKKKVEVLQGTGAPETDIAMAEEQVINAVFGNSVPAGEITIILDVKNLGDNPPSDDKTAAENKLATLSNFKLGQYLDIKLLKKIGSAAPETITNITTELTITFNIPSALLGKAQYSVIRVHNGVADVLEDQDKAPNTVTIKTDKFSTYVLTYKEKSSSSGSGGSGSSGGSSGGSGSSHRHIYIYDETVIKEPTCTESGEKTLSCSCGLVTIRTIPALGHSYRSEITKPATETENGIRTFTCTRCGDTYTEIIEKTGSESDPGNTSDNTSSGTSDTSTGTSDDTSSGTSASGDTSSDSGDTSSDNSGSSSGDSGTSSNSGSSSSGTGEDNPITGAAAAVPLMAVIAAAAALAVAKSRKK